MSGKSHQAPSARNLIDLRRSRRSDRVIRRASLPRRGGVDSRRRHSRRAPGEQDEGQTAVVPDTHASKVPARRSRGSLKLISTIIFKGGDAATSGRPRARESGRRSVMRCSGGDPGAQLSVAVLLGLTAVATAKGAVDAEANPVLCRPTSSSATMEVLQTTPHGRLGRRSAVPGLPEDAGSFRQHQRGRADRAVRRDCDAGRHRLVHRPRLQSPMGLAGDGDGAGSTTRRAPVTGSFGRGAIYRCLQPERCRLPGRDRLRGGERDDDAQGRLLGPAALLREWDGRRHQPNLLRRDGLLPCVRTGRSSIRPIAHHRSTFRCRSCSGRRPRQLLRPQAHWSRIDLMPTAAGAPAPDATARSGRSLRRGAWRCWSP